MSPIISMLLDPGRTHVPSFKRNEEHQIPKQLRRPSKKGRKEQPVQSQNLEEDDEEDSDSESDDYYVPS